MSGDDTRLIAEIDDAMREQVSTTVRCLLRERLRTRLAQPAITDAEVAACLAPLPDTLAHTYYRAEQMQGVIRRLAQPAIEREYDQMCLRGALAQIERKDKALRELRAAFRVNGLRAGHDHPAIDKVLRDLGVDAALSDTQEPQS